MDEVEVDVEQRRLPVRLGHDVGVPHALEERLGHPYIVAIAAARWGPKVELVGRDGNVGSNCSDRDHESTKRGRGLDGGTPASGTGSSA